MRILIAGLDRALNSGDGQKLAAHRDSPLAVALSRRELPGIHFYSECPHRLQKLRFKKSGRGFRVRKCNAPPVRAGRWVIRNSQGSCQGRRMKPSFIMNWTSSRACLILTEAIL